MSVTARRELQLRIEDLNTAMRAVRRYLIDESRSPNNRIVRALAILDMYVIEPPREEAP